MILLINIERYLIAIGYKILLCFEVAHVSTKLLMVLSSVT